MGVRTPGTLAVLSMANGGARLRLVTEVPTAAWPNHFEIVGDQLVVAGMHADRVACHRIAVGAASDQVVGPWEWSTPVPRPMAILG